jgi:ligand-binding sensor domain-containing protein
MIAKMKITLLFGILIIASSCNGQAKHSETTSNPGTTVSSIDKSIWVIFQDKKNNYWFGSNGNGVYCYNGKTLKQFTTKDGLSSNQIRGIQEDASGNLFFDTPNGVTKFNGNQFVTLVPFKSIVNQWKTEPNDLWFKCGGELTGAYRYANDTLYHLEFSTISSKKIDSKYAVYSIYKDKQGNIWFGTLTAGVCRFDGTTFHWITEPELFTLEDGRTPGVRSILEDKDGSFWFSNILYQYEIKDNHEKSKQTLEYEKVKKIDSSRQKVTMELPYYTSAVMDNNNNIWMTNYNEGVWKYDGKNLTNFKLKEGGANVLIVSVYKDNFGYLWLATDNAGVYKLNDKTFEKFNF